MELTANMYPVCHKCNLRMQPVCFWDEEEEYDEDGRSYYTGRIRRAVSHFECPMCGKKSIVDDSFDGPWINKVD